jgi:hypothetical protein
VPRVDPLVTLRTLYTAAVDDPTLSEDDAFVFTVAAELRRLLGSRRRRSASRVLAAFAALTGPSLRDRVLERVADAMPPITGPGLARVMEWAESACVPAGLDEAG